jgi:Zn-dependent protease with chaperone function
MQLAAFDALVERLEAQAHARPALYRAKVMAWVILGYGFLGLISLLAVVAVLFSVAIIIAKPGAATIKIGLLFGVAGGYFCLSVMRALWVRLSAPEGLVVTRAEAPQLFQMIDELTAAPGQPRIHRVVVTGEMNAAMAQVPRLGLLGWYANHLILGLPLLRALDVAEFRSVLAHELGHAGGGHGRFGAWIYRVRSTWNTLADRIIGQGATGSGLVGWFLRRYLPRFSAYSFVLARLQEYEADAAAVRAAGPAAGRALVRINTLARAEGSFWNNFVQRTDDGPEAPAGFLEAYTRHQQDLPAEQRRRHLTKAWQRPTDRVDTHPGLADRLHAMGQAPADGSCPALPPSIHRSAAEALLGTWQATASAIIDAHWRANNAAAWSQQHCERRQLRERQRTLAGQSTRSSDEDLEWAQLSERLDGDDAALAVLDRICTAERPAAVALFQRGRLRLERDDEGGLEDLRAAMAQDSDATVPAMRLMTDWLRDQGRIDEAAVCEQRGEAGETDMVVAQQERQRPPEPRQLEAPQLSDEQRHSLVQALSSIPRVRRVWVVRVRTQHRQEHPWHLVIVDIEVPWYRARSAFEEPALAQSVADAVPASAGLNEWSVYFASAVGSLRRRATALPGSVVIG